jgi:hypothetical protein
MSKVIVDFRNFAKALKEHLPVSTNVLYDTGENEPYVQLISRPICNEYVGYTAGCHSESVLSKSTTQAVVHTDV